MTCERVIIIDYGRIIAEDTAEGLTGRLRGSEDTRVRVAGPRDQVLAALRALPHVTALREEAGDAGCVTATVAAADGDALRRVVAERIVASGWGLLELRPLPMSLEDLFVRLVREDRQEPAA
jgi:ABC-2 type transport system ATP-binding protein